jgi:hypothetical protein
VTTRPYGWRTPTVDERDYRFRAPRPYTGAFVDLSANFPEEPYDQGQLGSCVSNGTAAALDFARKRQGLAPLERPSRLFIYYCGREDNGYPISEDTGLQVRDGLKVVGSHGAPPEDDWPYVVAKFTHMPPSRAYTDAKLDVAAAYGQVDQAGIDATVASGYPVVFGITLWESFESEAVAQTGVVPVPDKSREAKVGGHCMVIVSTPKDGGQIPGGKVGLRYYKVRNSWGTSWGDGGYCWIPEQVIKGSDADDFWALTTVTDPNGPQPPEPPSPRPDALVVAARNLAGDQGALDWLRHPHVGHTRHVAALVQAVVTAAEEAA